MREGLLFAIIIITNKNMLKRINRIILFCFFILFTSFGSSFSDDKGLLKKPINEVLMELLKEIRTIQRLVYSEDFQTLIHNNQIGDDVNIRSNNTNENLNSQNTEMLLQKHLLKLAELEKQIQNLTNQYEKTIFSLETISTRLSKLQADNQLRFQQMETDLTKLQADNQLRFQQMETDLKVYNENKLMTAKPKSDFSENNTLNSISQPNSVEKKILPGTSQPQELLGEKSYKDMTDNSETQAIESVDATNAIIQEVYETEEKILPEGTPEEQYQFANSFLKVGDYNNAERAFREFVLSNPNDKLTGTAQYWYAETFRIRQLYADAAEAYLEGYQKYPESEKAPLNLLRLGVSLVQIGEKDQGCLMIAGVKQQYPNVTQSVLKRAIYESKKFECKKENS